MARIRTIKPSFFKSEDVSVLPMRARLTWIGLWTHCDDQGRAKDNARLIKGDVWPLDDVSLRDIEEDLTVLAAEGRIIRYEVNGTRYLEVVNWHDHQKISKPSPSRIPGPSPTTIIDSRNDPGTFPEDSGSLPGGKGREKEGKGREGEHAREAEPETAPIDSPQLPPSPKCAEHIDHPDPPPCGRCADARKARQRYDRDQADAAARAQSERAREFAAAARTAIDSCRLCDSTGYRAGRLCAHDPEVGDRSRRGAAAAAAAIRRRPDIDQEAS